MGQAKILAKSKVSEANVQPGDCRFSADGACRLVSFGLVSDVAVIAHAPRLGLSALLRFVYPNAPADPEKAKHNPWLFADTGVSLLLSTLRKCGASNQDIQVRAIGGAFIPGREDGMAYGRSNDLAFRKALWAEGLLLENDDLGGSAVRAVWFDPATNRLMVRSDTTPRAVCLSARAAAREQRAS